MAKGNRFFAMGGDLPDSAIEEIKKEKTKIIHMESPDAVAKFGKVHKSGMRALDESQSGVTKLTF